MLNNNVLKSVTDDNFSQSEQASPRVSGVHARTLDVAEEAEVHAALQSERGARAFLDRFRFPHGFVCVGCRCWDEPWEGPSGLLACRRCARPMPALEGTPFSGPHPLRWWLGALWKATDGEPWTATAIATALEAPVDAAEAIQDGITAHWEASSPLYGVVYVGQMHVPSMGIVAMALELSAGAKGQCRFARVGGHAASLVSFAARVVDPDSIVVTSTDPIFAELGELGFDLRQQARLPRSRVPGTPAPDAAWEGLRRHVARRSPPPEDHRPVLEAFARTSAGRLDRHARFHSWLEEMVHLDPTPASP